MSAPTTCSSPKRTPIRKTIAAGRLYGASRAASATAAGGHTQEEHRPGELPLLGRKARSAPGAPPTSALIGRGVSETGRKATLVAVLAELPRVGSALPRLSRTRQ